MNAQSLIARHRLRPHPFEGYWCETAHRTGAFREGLQLLEATDEAGWHRMPALAWYEVVEGGPLSISVSATARDATGFHLMKGQDPMEVPEGWLRTLSCLGSYALLRIRLMPDIALTDRELMPDDWFPQG